MHALLEKPIKQAPLKLQLAVGSDRVWEAGFLSHHLKLPVDMSSHSRRSTHFEQSEVIQLNSVVECSSIQMPDEFIPIWHRLK